VTAKKSPYVLEPELFVLDIAQLFILRYPHISTVNIDLVQSRWSRLPTSSASTSSEPHPHAFVRDGDDKRTVSAVVRRDASSGKPVAELRSGLKDLLVLKSTGSAFEDFVRDEFTTLPEVDDRIMSTAIDCTCP
jgi:urate oxidase